MVALKAVVVIATVGRVSACEQALAAIDGRIHDASVEVRGIVSAPTEADLPRASGPAWRLITGSRGASAQRNAALDLIPADTDVVFFFDDDTIPRADYIARTCEFFASNPGVVATTGTLLADGAGEKREVPLEEAVALLDLSWETTPADSPTTGVEHFELYGCNAAVRWAAARDLRFDERLPLYSWLEDFDLARQLLVRGEIRKLREAVAVHRGSDSGGRTAHLRFGYSQVANPLWLLEKGTFTKRLVARVMLRPMAMNVILAPIPGKRYSMRRRRLIGNCLAVWDVMKGGGHATPERILELR